MGSRLQEMRTRRDMTQAELAERAGVNLRSLQDYEQGKKNINGAAAQTVYRLAVALHCAVEDLLEP